MSSPALHPDVREHVAALARLSEMALELGGESLPSRLEWAGCRAELAALELFTEHAPGVYSMPVILPDACRYMRQWANKWEYRVNEEEEPEYQIPEIALKHRHPPTYEECAQVFDEVLRPAFNVLYRLDPENITSIQLARYTPDNTSKGNWHRDEDSDCTAVVNLGSQHVGGGTRLFVAGQSVHVPPLPIGHALLFLGRTTLHCGSEVLEGQRDLLVFWSTL